jgi:hypothetical protein
MDVDTIVPSHGPLCDKDEIRTQLAWFEAAKSTMARLITEGASEEEAVNYEGYPEFYESTGDRMARSLGTWYKVLSKEG